MYIEKHPELCQSLGLNTGLRSILTTFRVYKHPLSILRLFRFRSI